VRDYPALLLRLALGITFLSAIADRFGWLGPPGTPNVSWGTFGHFVAYVGVLNWYLPKAVIPALAVVETAIETLCALLLVAGLWLRVTATASAVLLLSFALTLTFSSGYEAALSYSVWTAAAAALYLATKTPASPKRAQP
jgi:uncharacterized membrane protein YphA (DoxX/SURF4 family)